MLSKKLFQNKKGFLARTWVTAFITGIAIFSLCYFMVFGLATEYDNIDVINENFQRTYNKYSDLEGDITSMYYGIKSKEGLSVVGTFTTLFSATWGIISIILDSLLMPGAMLRQFSLDVGAPSAIANIIFTLPLIIITVIVVLVIISSISKGKL